MASSSDGTQVRVPPAPQGLTTAEAQKRLREEGPNELPSASRRGWVRILLEVLKEPMLLLLLVFGTLVASGLPAVIGAVAVLGSFFALWVTTQVTDVSIF
ncbi:MAG TPA: cation-transporting P-type ATPase, partial [Candidatus Cryosericum sp.]|nr:cation-transporting P-type ATPase [Candidatus Cryosericum sp.]